MYPSLPTATGNLRNRKFTLKSFDNKLHSWNIIFPIKKEAIHISEGQRTVL